MKTFGERCKELRKEKGLSQEEFAKIIGVNKGTVSKWETDVRLPEMNTIEQIADFFSVAVFYLMGAVDERKASVPDNSVAAEWTIEDQDQELLDVLKQYCRLSDKSKQEIASVIMAYYKVDKAEKSLLPDDQYEVSVRTADKYR